MNGLAAWYLVITFGVLPSHAVVSLPMATKAACVEALKTHGDYCISMQTGETIEQSSGSANQ